MKRTGISFEKTLARLKGSFLTFFLFILFSDIYADISLSPLASGLSVLASRVRGLKSSGPRLGLGPVSYHLSSPTFHLPPFTFPPTSGSRAEPNQTKPTPTPKPRNNAQLQRRRRSDVCQTPTSYSSSSSFSSSSSSSSSLISCGFKPAIQLSHHHTIFPPRNASQPHHHPNLVPYYRWRSSPSSSVERRASIVGRPPQVVAASDPLGWW
jgi:hypothetical protein